jgi:hypothetical protein
VRREPRLSKVWSRLKAGIVADVPADLDACETCREVDCTEERWLTCPARLAVAAERRREMEAARVASSEGTVGLPDTARGLLGAGRGRKQPSARQGRKHARSR